MSIESPFILVRDNSSTKTHVIFSSANIPKGKFSGTKAFYRVDVNYIFINCPDNNWYIDRIEGLGECYDDILINLRKIIMSLGSTSELVFYGGSMGAYGAFIYGLNFESARIFVTGLEYELGVLGGFYNKHCRVKDKIDLISANARVKDIVCNKSIRPSDVHVIYGERSACDMYCALKLVDDSDFNIYTVANEDHSIPPLLALHFDIAYVISDKKVESKLEFLCGDLLRFRDFVIALYKFSVKNESADLEGLSNISELSPITKSYYYYSMYLVCKRRKEFASAYQWVSKAIYLNKSCPLILNTYAEYCNTINRHELAELYSKLAVQFELKGVKPLYNAKLTHIESLIKMGFLSEANDEFSSFKHGLSSSAKNNPHINNRIIKISSLIED